MNGDNPETRITEKFGGFLQNNDEDDLETLMTSVGFQYYHFLARKFDLEPHLQKSDILKSEDSIEAFDYYEGNTLTIEIIKDDVLQKLYFRVKDKKVLREEIKEKIKYDVDRSSPSNKIRDFMDWSSDIIQDIKYQRRVHANPVGRLLVNAWIPLNYLVMIVTLAITVLVMVTWEAGAFGKPLYQPAYRFTNAGTGIYVLGGIHNFLSLGIFFSYIISNRPTFPSFGDIVKVFRKPDEDLEDEGKAWNEKKGESHLEISAYGFKTIYYVEAERERDKERKRQQDWESELRRGKKP